MTEDGRYLKSIENLFTKEAIERKFGIELDGEIESYADVPLIIGKKLADKYPELKKELKNKKEEIIRLEKIVKELSEDASKTELVEELKAISESYRQSIEESVFRECYRKKEHGIKIAKKMISLGQKPKPVEIILTKILKDFKILTN